MLERVMDALRSSVRPFITFGLVGVAGYLAIEGRIDPGQFWGSVMMILSFWFGERKVSSRPNLPTSPTESRGDRELVG